MTGLYVVGGSICSLAVGASLVPMIDGGNAIGGMTSSALLGMGMLGLLFGMSVLWKELKQAREAHSRDMKDICEQQTEVIKCNTAGYTALERTVAANVAVTAQAADAMKGCQLAQKALMKEKGGK